jgi:hypothetical protein
MIGERSRNWGVTLEEQRLAFACDRHLPDRDEAVFRGVDVDAPAPVVFRWLCQLRAAPYSYDWIDNLGRRSPRELTPGLNRLEAGQRVMTIFRLVEFERDVHLTVVMIGRPTRLFGEVAVTYLVVPVDAGRCRLLAKAVVAYPRGLVGAAMRLLLPPGDLVMMRKQLLNLKQLAERDASRSGAEGLTAVSD